MAPAPGAQQLGAHTQAQLAAQLGQRVAAGIAFCVQKGGAPGDAGALLALVGQAVSVADASAAGHSQRGPLVQGLSQRGPPVQGLSHSGPPVQGGVLEQRLDALSQALGVR